MWSEWSSCSRSCCLGVRCRSCLQEPCNGHATEICNTNVCSGKKLEKAKICVLPSSALTYKFTLVFYPCTVRTMVTRLFGGHTGKNNANSSFIIFTFPINGYGWVRIGFRIVLNLIVNTLNLLFSEKCTEPADCRKRQEFLSMSDNDKNRFINAFITVSTHSEWKHRFKALARIHFENFRGKTIHHRHEFLPWHRWFVLLYLLLLFWYSTHSHCSEIRERTMHRCACILTISLVAQIPCWRDKNYGREHI